MKATLFPGSRLPDGTLLWITWSFCLALSWLLPMRLPPWPTFYCEVIAALCFLTAAIVVLSSKTLEYMHGSRGAIAVDRSAQLFFALAIIPIFQAVTGKLIFPAEFILPTTYLVATGMCIVFARLAHQQFPWVLIQSVLLAIVVAAVLSTGIAIYQRVGLSWLGMLVSPDGFGARAKANMGQSNNLATLLCIGLVGVWWFNKRAWINAWVSFALAAFIVVGVALTQSRTGILELLVFPLILMAGWKQLGGVRQVWAMVSLGLWGTFVWVLISTAQLDIFFAGGRPIDSQLSAGYRPIAWSLIVEAILRHPLIGWGWNQILMARVELASGYPSYKELITYSHNIVLDLFMWIGVPLGLSVIVAVMLWFKGVVRNVNQSEHWLILIALLIFGVHAMLEFPYAYLYFLLPVATFVGTLNAELDGIAKLKVSRWIGLIVCLVLTTVTVIMVTDYRKVEDNYVAWRIYNARIGPRANMPESLSLMLLQGPEDAKLQIRKNPRLNMSSAERLRWKESLVRYPDLGGLARYAKQGAMDQAPDEAEWALHTICLLYLESQCVKARNEWLQFVSDLSGHANDGSTVK